MSTPDTPALISAAALAAELGRADLVVIDASFDLADLAAGRAAYEAAHIPGAAFLDIETELSGPKRDAAGTFLGRHPLPARDALARRLGELGVTPATRVVAYDRQGSMYAARLWWLLLWLGHADVRVLDGGWQAWQAGGGASEAGARADVAAPVPYPARAPRVRTIGAAELLAQLADTTVVDARAAERYRGEVEPLDAAAGHIPGALNRFFKANLQDDGRFRAPAELRVQFEQLLAGRDPAAVVHQCGSGVTACHNLLAAQVAGLPMGVLYPGSWSEWSADPARPIAVG